jgi:hypothetical protein
MKNQKNPVRLVCSAVALLVLAASGWAQPRVPVPTLREVMAGSLTNRAKIRWVKVVDGKEVVVTIAGGIADRLNPNMSPEPVHLKFDLDRNRELERQVKATRLGSPGRRVSSVTTYRTLQILAEGPKDDVVVGQWSLPLTTWKKKNAQLVDTLEPLFDAQPDVFERMKGPDR